MSYGCTDIAFAPYGEYWRRKICILELLSPKRVQSFQSLREEEILNLARWIASNAGSPISLTEKMYSSTYSITSKAAFGMKTKEQETFVSIVQESIRLASGFDIADVYPSIKLLPVISGAKSRLRRLHQQADRILENIIDEHKVHKASKIGEGQKQEDLVDVLLKFQEDGVELPLTTDNIKSVILASFLTNYNVFYQGAPKLYAIETLATTVDWAMSEMLKNPRVLKRAQDEVRQVFKGKGYPEETCFHELKYLKLVIKETLRLHPPLPLLLPRECRQRCKINGLDIPVKAGIIVNAWAVGRDPQQWADAESFSPERFLNSSADFLPLATFLLSF
ncbi:hypothetical protein Pfo_023099 [Paulownia fortunei]|nr:hypothetical protein Pfo_023099 [Paulownia fortunei]